MIRKRIYDFFWRLVRPSYWVSLYPVNYDWDDILNSLMDAEEKVSYERISEHFLSSKHTVFIGRHKIWIENYPYAFGSPESCPVSILPRAKTRKRLYDYLANPDNYNMPEGK